MSSILLHAWTLHKKENKYYIPYTHWVYLSEIVKYYDKVYLLSPVNKNLIDESSYEEIEVFKNVEVYELPYSNGYIDAVKHFFKYKQAYKELSKKCDVVYARYPIPFGWLQKIYGKNASRIIHYVGDPVDAALNNPNFSSLRKKLLINLFKPENQLYDWACKGAKVYTNGYHISERLANKNIIATPLISSTLVKKDFHFNEVKHNNRQSAKVLYVGYLRTAKGVETVLKAFGLLQIKFPDAELTIVGTGDYEKELREMVINKNMQHISFLGHIDNRNKLNDIFRNHDIFCFASLSEGSPRVVLEAMANGINVVSTPVGSLPYIFEDNSDILFADFNNFVMFSDKMESLLNQKEMAYKLRLNAFNKVKTFTIESFIKQIFNEA